MKFYFNRTKMGIFEREEAKEEFYNDFFAKYDINPAKDVYFYFCEDANMNNKLYDMRAIIFSKGRIIIFDSKFLGRENVPYEGYSVAIHKQSEIKSIHFDCEGGYNFPLSRVKIDMGSSLIEFEIKKEYYNAKDCDDAIAFLSKLLEIKE